MGECKVKFIYDQVNNLEELQLIVNDVFYDTLDSGKKEITSDFYNNLIKMLKSEDTPFQVEYSSEFSDNQKKLYKESIPILIQDIKDSIKDYSEDLSITELDQMLDKLQSDLYISQNNFKDTTQESFTIEKESAQEENKIKEISLNRFIDNTYKGCFGAIQILKNQFSRDMFMRSVCNFKDGVLVTTDLQLNDNIALYKNELVQKITQFLKTINNKSYPDCVYTDDGEVHRRFYDVLSDMEEYMSSINLEQKVNEEYSKKIFNNNSILLDAINAYTSLKYFDTLLQDSLGRTIKFNRKYKNVEIGLEEQKYSFAKDTSHQRKSWTDSEVRTAIQNSSKFSKFVLDSIPLVINGKDSGRSIGISQFYMTLTKVFSNVSKISSSTLEQAKELGLYLKQFHDSPILYAYKIINLITNSYQLQNELKSIIQLSDTDLGIIQSLYKYVYSYDSEMNIKNYANFTNKSIRTIEFNQLKTSYNIGKYSILNDITGAMNDCMDASYFQVTYTPDGDSIVGVRPKYKDRRLSEKFKDSVNSANITNSQNYRELLSNNCKVEFESKISTNKAKVTIPLNIDNNSINLSFIISSKGTFGILEQKANIQFENIEENQDIALDRVFELFSENSLIDISLESQRTKLLSDNLTQDEQIFKQILKIIDDRLQTGFLSEEGLKKLSIFKSLSINKGNKEYIRDLLVYSIKSQIVSDIYYEFNNKLTDSQDTYINNIKDFMKFLKGRYVAFRNLTNEQKKTYFITNNGISRLRTIPSNTTWTDTYALATLILHGEANNSVSKNQSNNNDANYVTSFLGGQIYNVCYRAQKESQNSSNKRVAPASSKLLFTNNIEAIKQCVINSDIKNRENKVKSIRDLNSSELFYNAIIHNFWLSFINTGEYCIQPTTYSDKVKLIQYLIDGKSYKFGEKSLSEMSKEELIELYRSSIGEASNLALQNVIDFYQQLWGESLTIGQINQRLKSYTQEKLNKEAFSKNLEVILDFHYRVKKKNGKEFLTINEIIPNQAQYSNIDILREKFKQEEIQFVNNLVDSGVSFYVDYHDTSLYNSKYYLLSNQQKLEASKSPIAKILLKFFQDDVKGLNNYFDKWIKNGKLVLAYQGDIPILHTNVDGFITELNPLLERYFYTDTLLANNLRYQLTGFETNHPDKSKFTKMWDNVVKGMDINNPYLLMNNIKAIQKAKIWLVSENVNEVYDDKIITNDSQILDNPKDVIDLRSTRLSINDLKALNDLDLYELSQSNNYNIRAIANKIITIIENISQGTQLKRNVIIPATMHYMNGDFLEGVPKDIKVSIIYDMKSKVFNFNGDSDTTDSMDGSAYTTMEQSILENKTLGSQEVGQDKKPIWHYYSQTSSTAGLMKFASFVINNERMRMSLNSTAPLLRMYKKMNNLQWANFNDYGEIISWNTSRPITLGQTTKLTSIKPELQTLDFISDILDNQQLFYRTYENGELVRKQIVGFGGNALEGYYTIESYVRNDGYLDLSKPQQEKIYHYFNSNSEHILSKNQLSGYHTINSLYELWLSMGGMYSMSLNSEGILQDSESSHNAVVGFMNKTMFLKEGADQYDLTQNSYDQPLKQMMIGYLTNNSGMKNGAANINSSKRWTDDEDLLYMNMSSEDLGIQMDAEHDVEEAEMTEFSQVIAALEAGGSLHKYSKSVYQDLAKVAVVSSKIELDTVIKFLQTKDTDYDKVKSELYNIIGTTILNNIKTKEGQASLTSEVLKAIKSRFNKNIDHLQDTFKIPFSDNNIYSQILPSIASVINQKSIKRKYTGSGCVLVPGFNVAQYFYINGQRYMFNDLVQLAIEYYKTFGKQFPTSTDTSIFEKEIVTEYLNYLQEDSKLIKDSVDEFIPTDIVDIIIGDDIITLNLDDLKTYYAFKDIPKLIQFISDNQEIDEDILNTLGITIEQLQNITYFRYNIRSPKNLAPSKITWNRGDNGKLMNVFDLKPFRDAYENPTQLNRDAVNEAFNLLAQGFFIDENGNKVRANNLSNTPAELIISNLYANKFGVGNKSIAQINKEGIEAFRIKYQSPKESNNYDLIFRKLDGNDTYITFKSPKGNSDFTYSPYNESNLFKEEDENGNVDVYLISDDNRKLFKVGRYILKKGYQFRDGKFYDGDNKELTYKQSKNLKSQGSNVYKYVEFVSQYKVKESFNEGENTFFSDQYDIYYIDVNKLKYEAFNRSDDKKEDEKEINKFFANILDDIYSTKQFLDIVVNTELTSDSAGFIARFVSKMQNIDSDFKQMVINPIETELRQKLEQNLKTISIQPRDKYQEYYNKLVYDRYSSWKQSLYFTAARIPAQTLQSFMQMEAIAYTGNSLNSVFVSHWQAWLQGSDFSSQLE